MRLGKLLSKCEYINMQDADIEISSLAIDSDEVIAGSLFFCITGYTSDGHNYAIKAIENGAVAIVVERYLDIDAVQILVKNTRTAICEASSNFYSNPSKKLKIIAITGTNGKTTTSYILQSILNHANKKCGIIGTNGIVIAGKEYPASLTTPDPIEFHSILAKMVLGGMDYVVMEVSAHALSLQKMYGVNFEVSAFTNLTQDHLDFFKDMDTYFDAKKLLFSKELSKCCVINVDDMYGQKLAKECRIPFMTYGCFNPSDIFAIDLIMCESGLRYVLNLNDEIVDIQFSITGIFNMYNTLCASAIASSLGICGDDIACGIKKLNRVDGRFNVIPSKKCTVIVDFAHTPDGVLNVLKAVKQIAKKRVISVFGCGGDRDKTKRAIMGSTVAMHSDYFIVTSDNPRSEQPIDIINDIVAGVNSEYSNSYCIEVDRKKAIQKAIDIARKDDIVVVVGKGAEKYMEINGNKIDYNDETQVYNALGDLRL